MATSPCGAVFIRGCDLRALALHPDGSSFSRSVAPVYAAWLGAGGEESVNPAFLGEVTAVCSEEENALVCSLGWERSALGGQAG